MSTNSTAWEQPVRGAKVMLTMLAAFVASAITASSAMAVEMTKATFLTQCSAENSVGSRPACDCTWKKIIRGYTGEERKFIVSLYTTSFANWEPTTLDDQRQDELLDESLQMTTSCGVKIKP